MRLAVKRDCNSSSRNLAAVLDGLQKAGRTHLNNRWLVAAIIAVILAPAQNPTNPVLGLGGFLIYQPPIIL